MPRLRCLSLLFACLTLCCAGGSAQQTATFSTKTFAAGTMPRDVYAVDVNADGVPDLIEDTLGGGHTISLMLAYGTGNFQAPKTLYTFPSTYQGTTPMASGDFNGDGKVDLVFALAGSNQLAVFPGNGDGTFKAPEYETVALPGGQTFGGGAIMAADFNHDGKVDLVTEGNTSSAETLYLLPGQGDGTFGTPQSIYTFAAGTGMGSLAVGDFDGDGNADVAVGVNSNCGEGGCSQEAVEVLYGNGAAGFTSDQVYNASGSFSFASGDVNSDGRTDLYGAGGSTGNDLVVLTAQPDRQFTTFTMPSGLTLSGSEGTAAPMALGDFNGDGHMDLAAAGFDGSSSVIAVFLANGSGGYQEQTIDLGSAQYVSNVVAGTFGQDTKPDLAAVWSGGTGSATLTVAQNTTASGNWGGCAFPYPAYGVNYCSPISASQNAVRITATATSFGPMRKMEAWVDGKKIAEQYHVWENRGWLDLTTAMSPGTHQVTVIAANVDGTLLDSGRFAVDVVACEAPSSPGVTICSPANGTTVGEDVNLVAAASVTGTLKSIELWVDGVQTVAGASTSPLVTTITLAAGSHRLAVLALNTAGEKWESVANVTVPPDLGCNAPSSPGVHLCSPTNGASEEETGVVEVLATANVTGKLASVQLWVDGAKETSESTSSTLHIARYPIGIGTHRIAVLATNTAGQVWEQAATVTSSQ